MRNYILHLENPAVDWENACTSYFSTVITQSGHIVAQNAQPMHACWSVISAGECPFALIFSFAS